MGLSITKLRRFIAGSGSDKIFKIGEYLAKLQAQRWLSRAFCAPGHHTAKSRRKCDTIHLFAHFYARYLLFIKIFLLEDFAINLA